MTDNDSLIVHETQALGHLLHVIQTLHRLLHVMQP